MMRKCNPEPWPPIVCCNAQCLYFIEPGNSETLLSFDQLSRNDLLLLVREGLGKLYFIKPETVLKLDQMSLDKILLLLDEVFYKLYLIEKQQYLKKKAVQRRGF
jgi:hypothetical protein